MTLNRQLAKILAMKDESELAESFERFCIDNAASMPLPGENPQFDKAMWTAAKFSKLSKSDASLLNKVTAKLLEKAEEPSPVVLKLKEMVGSTKQAAIDTWQDLLSAMSWQQLVPAGALRGVGTQMVSLGTIQRVVDDITIQVNLGWHVDQDQLRLLMQAKGKEQEAIEDVEIRVTELAGDVVFSRSTNEDGTVVAPSVSVKPGDYKIQVLWSDNVIETPFFRV
ncbi:MAG TPA: carboxypeptidase-like regulatory domain-containing protein [Oculatellaceae cyanobacterium]